MPEGMKEEAAVPWACCSNDSIRHLGAEISLVQTEKSMTNSRDLPSELWQPNIINMTRVDYM